VEAEGDPEPVAALKAAIRQADALLIVTPEYNFGVPGVLKNAIDWASRPPRGSALQGKPAAIMGATPGMGGTGRAQMQLRQTFVFTQTHAVLSPEVLVARAGEKFDASGHLTDEPTRKFVAQLLPARAEEGLAEQGPASIEEGKTCASGRFVSGLRDVAREAPPGRGTDRRTPPLRSPRRPGRPGARAA
jgi:NAD(P)H-dependent FMN reductase